LKVMPVGSRLGRFYYRYTTCGIQRTITRSLMSEIVEPPLVSNVIERPCTFVLLEDIGVYPESSSWRDELHDQIPAKYGMSFGYISKLDHLSTFEQRVNGLVELSTITDAVLVARGPLASWSAQLYLESFSVQGLVMMDPILFDHRDGLDMEATKELKRLMEQRGLQSSGDYRQLEAISQGLETRKLKLEPSPVPILVLQTLGGDLFTQTASDTVLRHSDVHGSFGDVQVADISQEEEENKIHEAIRIIDSWIDESVL
jgi:hypothetical protein